MSKIAPTDEMVDRALKKARWHVGKDINWRDMADILEAAINIPQEPEIEVTRKMMIAGMNANGTQGFDKLPDMDCGLFVATIYRAMHAARPKECNHVPVKMTYQWGEHGKPSTQYETHVQYCMKCGAKLV